MGWSVSLSELREMIRERYDLPAFSAVSHVKLAAVDSFINQAVRRYYSILQEEEAEHLYTAEATATTAADTATVAMPSGAAFRCEDVLAIDWVRDSETVVRLARADRDSFPAVSLQSVDWMEAGRPLFAVLGSSIYLFPKPAGAYTLRIWYVRTPARLVLDADSIDGGPGWADFVVTSVCAMVARKEQSPDARDWSSERDQMESSIRTQCERKNLEPVFVRRSWRRVCSPVGLMSSGGSSAGAGDGSWSYDMGGVDGPGTYSFDGGSAGAGSSLVDMGGVL